MRHVVALRLFTTALVMAGWCAVPLPAVQAATLPDARITLFRESRMRLSGFASAFFVDGQYVASGTSGRVDLLAVPGKHLIAQLACESSVFSKGCDPQRIQEKFEQLGGSTTACGNQWFIICTEVDLSPGQHVYLEFEITDKVWVPVASTDRSLAKTEPLPQAVDRFERAGLGSVEQAVFDRCAEATAAAPCQDYLTQYPQGELRGQAEEKLRSVAERQRRIASLRARVPPEMRRDQLTVSLATQLKAGNYAAALPVFEELAALPLPPDPELDFFWGKSLVGAGRPVEGLEKLYAYLSREGRSAQHYAEALEWISRGEASL